MVLVGRMDEGMSHLILLSVPLFVFLGPPDRDDRHGAGDGGVPGEPARPCPRRPHYVLVGAMYLVSGIFRIEGGRHGRRRARSVPGDEAARRQAGRSRRPPGPRNRLRRNRGPLPPSLVLITIGSVTGVSISALFTGGLLPGVVLAITLSALVWWRLPRRGSEPCHARQQRPDRQGVHHCPARDRPSLRDPLRRVEGIATATEVSTIGIVYKPRHRAS